MGESAEAGRSRPRVLVVDDDPGILEAVAAALGKYYEVLPLSEGDELPDEAEAFSPDLIILDVRLRDSHGFQLCRELKRRGSTQDIPVLFLTGMTADTDFLAGIEAGGQAYLTKPVSPARLRRAVRGLLEGAPA